MCLSGSRICLADGSAFGPCEEQIVPLPEACTAVDDDCDGLTDEDLGATTRGLGPC